LDDDEKHRHGTREVRNIGDVEPGAADTEEIERPRHPRGTRENERGRDQDQADFCDDQDDVGDVVRERSRDEAADEFDIAGRTRVNDRETSARAVRRGVRDAGLDVRA
jgi:hypothetical protein